MEATPGSLTVESIKSIIKQANLEANNGGKQSKPKPKPKPQPVGAVPSTWMFVSRDLSLVAPMNRYDEVFPGIFLGDETFARDKELLRSLGITHLLNAAQGQKFNQIDTSSAYYADLGLVYMGISAQDVMGFKLAPHFRPAANFIDECLKNGGKIAVHCHMGRSRSASLVLAYLMLHRDKRLGDAIREVCLKRPVYPNDGFLKQLIALERQLHPEVNMTDSQNIATQSD